MGVAKYNWEYLKPIIYQLYAEGESLRAIAEAVDVNVRALYTWWNTYGNPDYEKFPKKRYCVKQEIPERKVVDYADIFRTSLKIGNKIEVKMSDNNIIKGTVIAKYPYIFTINCGKWKESFSYNSYMDIKIKKP